MHRPVLLAAVVAATTMWACGGDGDSDEDSVAATTSPLPPPPAEVAECPDDATAWIDALAQADGTPYWRWCTSGEYLQVIDADDQSVYVVATSAGQAVQPTYDVLALSTTDGTPRWRIAVPPLNEGFETSAMYAGGPFAGGGVVVLDMLTANRVDRVGYDALTGTELWRTAVDGTVARLSTDTISVATTAYAGDSAAENAAHPGVVEALDRTTGAPMWSVDTNVVDGEPVAVGDAVLVPLFPDGEPTRALAFDAATGDALWEGGTAWFGAVGVAPDDDAGGDGVVVGWHDETHAVGVDARDGSVRWQIAVDQAFPWVEPDIAGDTLVVTSAGTVSGHSVGDGAEQWSEASDLIPITASDDTVVLANESTMAVWDADGTHRWEVPTGPMLRSDQGLFSPLRPIAALNDNLLFVASAPPND